MLPNLLQYPVVALGVLKAQAVVVNVNPLYTPHELQRILIDSGANTLVVLANVAHNASAILGHTAVRSVVLTQMGDLLGWFRGSLINLLVRHVKRLVKPHHFPQAATGLRQALRSGGMLARTRPAPTATFSADSLAVLQYTGGTTGVMKAAMLSHRNLLCNVEQIANSMGEDFPGAGAVMVAPLPLYHIYAFNLNFVMSLLRGHQALLIPNPRDVDAFIAVLGRVKMRGFVGINTLYSSLLDNPGFRQLDFTTLALAASGGMPLSPQVAAAWRELTGKPILEGYGLTECSPMVSCNTHRYHRAGTAGRIAAGTEVRLFASDGSEVACGGLGEICVRGPQVMQGYWNNAAETAHVIDADGWLHTGDIGQFDQDGYLRIVDRIKDLIVVSGFNVYPNEIEDYACSHPDINDACAINAGDELSPLIKLFVVSRNPALTAEQVIVHCRRGLTTYKIPRQVEFRTTLPKSHLGKVLRRELRDSALATTL
jgi:long-chain acyl-CoA synthetase